jgi:20S proteasome alpha/beta subunit
MSYLAVEGIDKRDLIYAPPYGYNVFSLLDGGDQPVTVCIAVACEGGKNVVVASDKMVSVSPPSVEFEHAVPKICRIAKQCLAMASGSALTQKEVLDRVNRQISREDEWAVQGVVEIVSSCFMETRNEKADIQFFRPRSLSIKDFYNDTTKYQSDFLMSVDRENKNLGLPLVVLVCGVDDSGAHIYRVVNPGQMECWDSIGFHAIGSGEAHAIMSLIANKANPGISIRDALYLAYEAKRRAEVASGVGQETNMAVISRDSISDVPDETLIELGKIYTVRMQPNDEMKPLIAGLELGWSA